MNNDYLRVNSKESEDGIVEGVYAAKAEKKSERDDTPTLYTFFHRKNLNSLDFQGRLPSLAKPLAVFLVALAFIAALTLIAVSAKSADAFLVLAVAVAFLAPLFFISVFFEFNTFKNVSFPEILGGFTVGALYYAITAILKDYLSEIAFDSAILENLLFTLVTDCGLIIIAYFFVRLMRKANLFASFLLVVCVFGGFAFINSLIKISSSLFSSVKITGEEQFAAFAIVRSDKFFGEMLNSFVAAAFKVGVYESTLYFCWSVISAGVISLKVSPLKSVYNDGSMYFLIVLQLVMHIIEDIGSVLFVVDMVLKIVSVVVSMVVAFKMLNFVVMKNPRKV